MFFGAVIIATHRQNGNVLIIFIQHFIFKLFDLLVVLKLIKNIIEIFWV